MKYLFILMGLILFVLITVLYFQLYAGSTVSVPFFTDWVEIKRRTSMVIVIAFFCGVFMALGISRLLHSGTSSNDDFDL